MHSKNMVLALLLGMSTASVFAEPALQEGDTLESLSKVRISVTLQEPLAVEVDAPELEETAAEHGVVASAQPQTTVETATTEMVDVLEIDVPEVE
ncbi:MULTISPECIES: hypothetical protein [unclassified Acinetobacter]|uniref:hypothetical protein n=1 Tax=unclassified Acinetobacter TaxID=196816 RepID=UPI0015D26500|nr:MULTISPECIES: hypothetical protein [unclassified Acinetobacter]